MIEAYLQELFEIIENSSIARTPKLTLDKRSSTIGFIHGEIYCVDGSELHFRELVDMKKSPIRVMYSYHYQGKNKKMIFRFDNAEHFPKLPNFPHHKHIEDGKVVALEESLPDLGKALTEIADLISR